MRSRPRHRPGTPAQSVPKPELRGAAGLAKREARWQWRRGVLAYSTSILWTQPKLSSTSPDWMPVRVSRSFLMTGPTSSMP